MTYADLAHRAQQLRAAGKPNFGDHDWRPMTKLLHRPWFDRRWIIQEVTLADDSVPGLQYADTLSSRGPM
jgi:hypothetical protein